MANRSFAPRKSVLDEHLAIVGVLSDREVAEKVGVTTENVRTYRIRRNIPAQWRAESAPSVAAKAPAPAPAAAAPKAAAPAKASKAKAGKQRKARPTKLNPFRALLGVLPDADVAERAGVSTENVRAFRKRHGIEAGWRTGAAAPVVAVAAQKPVQPAPPPTAAAPRPAAPSPKPTAPRPGDARLAFRIVVEADGETRDYVAFAADIVHAARLAAERITAARPKAVLRRVELVGLAL